MSEPKRRWEFSTVLLLLGVAVSVGLIGVLGLQNVTLKKQLASLTGQDLTKDSMKPGDQIDLPASASGVDRSLLFVFSGGCTGCQEILPTWNEIAATHPGISITGIAVDDAEFQEARPLFSVDRPDRETTPWLEKISFVPATIVLDAGGTIVDVWFGVLSPGQRDELDALLYQETAVHS